ncbi:MAG: RtcB family protein [Spirochaetota bacterium]
MKLENLEQVNNNLYEIPVNKVKGMRVPARIFASAELIEDMDDAVMRQITNVAMLPGIQEYAFCMPDGHSGYGFPIGGVAAIDIANGVISPGGIGFDINCGVRLAVTSLTKDEIKPYMKKLMDVLYSTIPSGIGGSGIVSLADKKLDEAMVQGAAWAVKNGYGEPEDLVMCEEGGRVNGAEPASVSQKARERGRNQLGSLGSGNHYLELQIVEDENIFNRDAAKALGLKGKGQIVCMIHCGSRGFGHQVATDYLRIFASVVNTKYKINIPDRELSCAPFDSEEGSDYFGAMNCAINIAFLNRQLILHRVREVFCDVLGKSPAEIGFKQVYDVCHNTAKLEDHVVGGKKKKLIVHRKGATRAFSPGMEEIPDAYEKWGQPVLIGGSMETGSYVMLGKEGNSAFYSTVHGSGRVMSRKQAKKSFQGRDLLVNMESRGMHVRTGSYSGLAEEAGGAYKNIDEVIKATESAGLSSSVARLVPLGTIKG